MADEPRLVVALEARLTKFERDLAQAGVIADRQVRQIEDRFSKANPQFGGQFLKGLLGGLAGALSVDVLEKIVKSVADIADEAERVAISTSALQALRISMQEAGGSANELDSAMARFGANVGKAADGTSYLARVFEANNVAMKDANGNFLSQEQLLSRFAVLVKNAATEQDKMRLASEAFGRGAGPRMVAVLNDIADKGLPGVIREAEEAGRVIDREMIKTAEQFEKEWNAALGATKTGIQSLTVSVIAAVRTWVEELQKVQRVGRTFEEFQRGLPASGRSIAQERTDREAARFAAGGGGAESIADFIARTGAPRTTTVPPNRPEREGGRDAFERQEDQIRRRIALIETETRTMGLSTQERERARIETELLTAAERAEMEVTPKLREQVAALADEYGRAAARAEQAREIISATKEFGSALADAFKGAVLEGQKLDEVLKNLINRLSSRAIDSLFNLAFNAIGSSILGGLTGPGGGVLPGGLPLGMGGIGRAASGVDNWRGGALLVGEEGPEILNLPRGSQIIPNHISRALGSSMTFAPVTTIDARGSTMGEAQFRAILAESNRQQQRQIKDQLPTWMARQQALGKM